MAKLQGGATGQWDIGAPTAEYVPGMKEQGFIQKLDLEPDPERKYINKAFKGLWWDPTDEWQLPKDWGTTGIALRTKVVKEPVTTWAEFLEIAPKYSGRIVIVDSPGDVFVAPLKARGKSLNSTDPAEMEQARRICSPSRRMSSPSTRTSTRRSSRPRKRSWASSGPATCCRVRDVPETADTVYNIPADGTLFWLDTWVIFNEAPHSTRRMPS